jgi:hypothetical protein
MYETTHERAERIAEQTAEKQAHNEKRLSELDAAEKAPPMGKIQSAFWITAAIAIFIVAPIAVIVWIGSAIFGGDEPDRPLTKTEAESAALYLAWDQMDPSDQNVMCRGWDLAPRSSYDTLAASWGSTVPPYETVSFFFRRVC